MAEYIYGLTDEEEKRISGNPYGEGKEDRHAPYDFSSGRMAGNIWPSAVALFDNFLGIATNPGGMMRDTAKLLEGGIAKTSRKLAEATTGEEIPPVPSESYPEAAMDAFMDRWGSVNAAKRTLEEDPVGAVFDVGSVASPATRLIPGAGKARKVAQAVDPANAAMSFRNLMTKYFLPDDFAPRQYANRVGVDPKLPERRVNPDDPPGRLDQGQFGLDERAPISIDTPAKLTGVIDELQATLDAMINDAKNAGIEVPTKAVGAYLEGVRRDFGKVDPKARGKADLAAIDKIAKDFFEFYADQPTMTIRQLQDFKTRIYKDNVYDPGRPKGPPVQEITDKAMARAAKDVISDKVPETAPLNERLSNLYNLRDQIAKSATLNKQFPDFVKNLVNNDALWSRILIGVDKIKKGEMTAMEKVLRNSTEIRFAMVLADRYSDLLEEDYVETE